ncbi:MAG: DUF255 domain-containing protein [Sediminibacterium sp.]
MAVIKRSILKDKYFTMKELFTVLSLFVVIVAQSQVVTSNVSLQEAFRLAKSSDKIVLLMIESSECNQCNEVAKQGFTNVDLARMINNSCITLKIYQGSENYTLADSLYSIGSSMGLLFLDADGNILTRYRATTSQSSMYVDLLNKALAKKEKPDNLLRELQSDYNSGKKDFDLLYKLVRKKNELELEHDQLTEEMLDMVPKDSANSLTFLQFLSEQSPVINSKADVYLRKDQRNFNDAWYLMSLQKRSTINNRIIIKSRNKAIKEKNLAYAEQVANFTAATNTDRVQARKGHDKNMIEYFKAVGDTVNFLSASVRYYDLYLMSINVDSLKRADSLRLRDMLAAATPVTIPSDRQATPNGTAFTRSSVQYAPIMQGYTNELNDGAWTIYTHTHDPVYTAKALDWAKRAYEFYPNPGAMDTYARLLYRTGSKEEAIAMEEKVIQISKMRRMTTVDFEEVLKKMKLGTVSIDKY